MGGRGRKTTDADTIFVMIAAYRDPDLTATIDDALRQADHPERLRFGVCIQDRLAPPERFLRHSQVRFEIVDPVESEGVGWARSRAQRFYGGEDHALQIDAHTRFEPGYDTTLIRAAAEATSNRPILTTYPCMFEPGVSVDRSQPPNAAAFLRFNDWGCIEYAPSKMNVEEPAGGSVPARHFCAGFAFTPGSFVAEVPYDPEIYFLGEEVSMAARAFTHGYDLLHPTTTLLYHHYARPGEPKHWEDHAADADASERLKLHHDRTQDRVRSLLGMDPNPIDLGSYGLGSARTLSEFETYCGVDFVRGLVERYAISGGRPPDAHRSPLDRALPECTFLAVLDVAEALTANARSWHVTVHDRFGTVRKRLPVTTDDIARLLLTDRPELVTPYRAYLPGGRWVLELRDGDGKAVGTVQGELRVGARSPSPVWG